MSKRLGSSRKESSSVDLLAKTSSSLHRCSFFPYQPSAIKHIASTPNTCLPQIAVIRETEPSRVEIMTPSSDWAIEQVIHAGAGENFECAVFIGPNASEAEMDIDSSDESEVDISSALKKNSTAAPKNTSFSPDTTKLNAKHILPRSESAKFPRGRFFTASVDGRLREWANSGDQGHATQISSVDVNGGAIWSLAVSPDQSTLAIGCEDGRIRLFSVYDRSVEFLRGFEAADSSTTPGESARILSLAWNPQGSTLLSGSASGSIKLWNPNTGRPIHSLRLNGLSIWSVVFSDSNTFVSADSKGQVQFWDVHSATLLQSFPAFGADVLALACIEGNRIFATGVDHKIVEFVKVTAPNAVGHTTDKWIIGGKRYFHTNDVKTLSALTIKYQSNSETDPFKERTVLLSGGVDCTLVVSDPVAFDRALEKSSKNFSAHQRRILPFSRNSPIIKMAQNETILAGLMANTNTIQVWKLVPGSLPVHLADLKLSRFEAITSFAISPNGSHIAILTASELKVFKINCQSGEIKLFALSEPLKLAKRASFPHLLLFTTDETEFLAFNSHEIIHLKLDEESSSILQTRSIASPCSPSRVAISSQNSLVLCTHNRVMQKAKDAAKFATIYESEFPITSVSFLEEEILITDCRNSIIKISDNGRNIVDFFSDLTREWKIRKEPLMGVQAHPTQANKISCWSDSTIAQLSNFSDSNKRKRSTNTKSAPIECKLIDDYRPILFFAHLSNGDSLVIERPWLQIVENFPPAFYRSRYGAQ
jgi:WD40 repeat protein